MKKQLDIENWVRKEQFQFFRTFDEPFFGVTVELDCTRAFNHCKLYGHSFFIYYLHKCLAAVNAIEEFKYRIIDDEVYVFDFVNGSATVKRPNGSFGFSYMDFYHDFSDFQTHTKLVIEETKKSTKLIPSIEQENIIHFSALPWINFTGLSHARRFSTPDSCPKISIGKVVENNGIMKMPVSVHVHHALADGYHVGLFIDAFQKLMDANEG